MTTDTARELPRHWQAIRQDWPVLTLYQRFETSIAYLLTVVVGAVILVAFTRLGISVVDTLVLRSLNPLNHSVFQQVFGQILTLLIALEFNHTLRYAIDGERGIIRARVVVLIALLEGQSFDPNQHEAVATVPAHDVEPGTVTREVRRGWRLGHELLRPAQVIVAARPEVAESWR